MCRPSINQVCASHPVALSRGTSGGLAMLTCNCAVSVAAGLEARMAKSAGKDQFDGKYPRAHQT